MHALQHRPSHTLQTNQLCIATPQNTLRTRKGRVIDWGRGGRGERLQEVRVQQAGKGVFRGLCGSGGPPRDSRRRRGPSGHDGGRCGKGQATEWIVAAAGWCGGGSGKATHGSHRGRGKHRRGCSHCWPGKHRCRRRGKHWHGRWRIDRHRCGGIHSSGARGRLCGHRCEVACSRDSHNTSQQPLIISATHRTCIRDGCGCGRLEPSKGSGCRRRGLEATNARGGRLWYEIRRGRRRRDVLMKCGGRAKGHQGGARACTQGYTEA